MLKLSEREAKRPEAAPTAVFDVAPGTVTAQSGAQEKVAFYAALFRARTDVYAVRWDSDRLQDLCGILAADERDSCLTWRSSHTRGVGVTPHCPHAPSVAYERW
jgi:hypothetical protein